MPTSDTQVRAAFRAAYGRMVDDCPPAADWDDLAGRPGTTAPGRRSSSWLMAVAVAVVAMTAVAGVLVLLASHRDDGEPSAPTSPPTTTMAPVLASIAVVFEPGEITTPEWQQVNEVANRYAGLAGLAAASEDATHAFAVSVLADEPGDPTMDALAVLDEYPQQIATSFAKVEFTSAEDAFSFQEAVTELDFVVAAVGTNGPRLGRGYGTPLPDDAEAVRAELWQHLLDADVTLGTDGNEVTTSVPTVAPVRSEPTYRTAPFRLADSPIVVHEVPQGDPPSFDTHQLGEPMWIVPLDDFAIDDMALDDLEDPLADDPIVALGAVGDITAFRVPVVALDGHHVCDWGVGVGRLAEPGVGEPYPLGECGVGTDPRPDLSVIGPRRYLTASGDSTSSVSPWVSQVFWSGLSDEVSVVAIEVDGSVGWWQRPVGGTAVFVVESPNEPVLRLIAYTADGDVLADASP